MKAMAYGYGYNVTDENRNDKKEEAVNNLRLNLERPGFVYEAQRRGTEAANRMMVPALGVEIDATEIQWSETEILGVRTLQATYVFDHPVSGEPE